MQAVPVAQVLDGPVVAGLDLLRRLTSQQVVVQRWECGPLRPRYFRLMDTDMPVKIHMVTLCLAPRMLTSQMHSSAWVP